MTKIVQTATPDYHHIRFMDWTGFIDWSEANNTSKLTDGWSGARTMKEAADRARKGLADDGLEALRISNSDVEQRDLEIPSQQFQTEYAEAGSDVDVARYLSGEQDCMITYWMEDVPNIKPIATIAIGMSVSGGVSSAAIRSRGMDLVALLQAIELANVQTEVWVDMTSKTNRDKEQIVRTSVRVKAAGEAFDAGQFMYAFTDTSMFRVFGFNSRTSGMPREFLRNLGTGGGGYTITEARHMEDYPDGTIYIPSMGYRDRDNTRDWSKAILRELGLVRD